MNEHVKRMLVELDQLDTRHTKLMMFMQENPLFKTLSPEAFETMRLRSATPEEQGE